VNAPASSVATFAAQNLAFLGQADGQVFRDVPVEAPIAIEYNGIGYAVMMATPADLEAYAIGFTLLEGLVTKASDIESIDVHPIEGGWVMRITLPPSQIEPVIARARSSRPVHSCSGRTTK